LLRINLALVDFAGVGDRGMNRIASDLVKEHAPDRDAVLGFYLLRDVPRDRFALSVRIGRQENLARVFRRALQVRDRFLFSGNRHVFGFEAVLYVDSHLLLRKIAHVADRRPHAVRAAEIFADGLGLGG